MADTANPTDSTPNPAADDEWEDFDAERAKNLITKLRGEVRSLKTERDTARDEVAALQAVDEDKADRGAETAPGDAEALAELRRELYVERALRKHSVPEELVEFLTGDDEDSILSKAEKLAGLNKAPSADPAPSDDTAKPPAPTRPTPGLKPGHGGDEAPVFDPDAIVAAARAHV